MSISILYIMSKKLKNIQSLQELLECDADFIEQYCKASNASTGSFYDANANVQSKNVVTLAQELPKGINIMRNRSVMTKKITELYGADLASQYLKDLDSHVLYKHDESASVGIPYCVAISMYPFLTDGLTKIGGISTPPTDTKSFCGEFINLVFSIASQFAGAVATPEFLMYMDYFLRKDYGDNYLDRLNEVVVMTVKHRTLTQVIDNYFQQVVHSMNMPTGARGYQTVFWNIGYFDKPYFEGVFGDFRFPDGSAPKWETLSWLQKHFMEWFNQERTKYVLTFPVETMALLTDGKDDFVDQEYADFTAGMWAKGHSFFCYLSDSPDSLSSCCRLRNSINRDKTYNVTTHQYSMGTASVATGSKSVMTIDLNRLIQDAFNSGDNCTKERTYANIMQALDEMVTRVHKYQHAFNEILKDFYKAHMLPVYEAGFISMKKQYLTIGVNGLTDAARFLNITPKPCDEYHEFVNNILETINKCNRRDKTPDLMFNTEFVPGENLSYKNYEWDKKDGYKVSKSHSMYSSYFYDPEDTSLTIIDKFKLHGKDYVKYLDGGSALHMNLDEHLSKEQYRQLMKTAAFYGTNYFTFNVRNTVCNDCGYISKNTEHVCPKCGSENIDYLTRVIGYLKRVSNFSEARQKEAKIRYYDGEPVKIYEK